MITFTLRQIADFAAAHPEIAEDLMGCADDDETHLDRVMYYLSEARETTFARLAELGLKYTPAEDDDAGTISLHDVDSMTLAYRLIDEIDYEYDATKPKNELPTNHWQNLGLSGDDAVDYNSSYLSLIFDLILEMLPPEWQTRTADLPNRDDYNLPREQLDKQLAEYKQKFYEQYPERRVADELRDRIHALVKAQHLSSDGLYSTADELQLYTNLNKNGCFVFKAPLTSAGPWVFTLEGYDNITITE